MMLAVIVMIYLVACIVWAIVCADLGVRKIPFIIGYVILTLAYYFYVYADYVEGIKG